MGLLKNVFGKKLTDEQKLSRDFFKAIKRNDVPALQELGKKINETSEFGISALRDEKGYTPLRYALRRKKLDAFKALPELGANVDERVSSNGMTILHLAISREQEDFADALIDMGADVRATYERTIVTTHADKRTTSQTYKTSVIGLAEEIVYQYPDYSNLSSVYDRLEYMIQDLDNQDILKKHDHAKPAKQAMPPAQQAAAPKPKQNFGNLKL